METESLEHLEKAVARLDAPTASTLFQIAEAKRDSEDQMMWQVPAISLTAQSFLLTIALGSGSHWASRVFAALLGLVAATAAVQLLLKHRFYEEMHSRWLEKFAECRGWPSPHKPASVRVFAYGVVAYDWGRSESHWKRARWWLTKRRSAYVWVGALTLFGIADLSVILAWIAHLFGAGNAFG